MTINSNIWATVSWYFESVFVKEISQNKTRHLFFPHRGKKCIQIWNGTRVSDLIMFVYVFHETFQCVMFWDWSVQAQNLSFLKPNTILRYARAIHTRLGKISLKYFIDNLNIIYQTDSFQTDFQKWRIETRQLSVFSSEQWKDFITTITTTTITV